MIASCGAAVAFKVVWAMARSHFGSDRVPAVMKRELVEATILAGLGTIADVMPLVEENRALAALALRARRDELAAPSGARRRLVSAPREEDELIAHAQVLQDHAHAAVAQDYGCTPTATKGEPRQAQSHAQENSLRTVPGGPN